MAGRDRFRTEGSGTVDRARFEKLAKQAELLEADSHPPPQLASAETLTTRATQAESDVTAAPVDGTLPAHLVDTASFAPGERDLTLVPPQPHELDRTQKAERNLGWGETQAQPVATSAAVDGPESLAPKARTVRVATVQLESKNGALTENLAAATTLVEQAARDGAQLVLLPEFLAAGYSFTKDIWSSAEPKDGPTVRWLQETSARLGLYLGTTFLEAEGSDFYNTFVLTGPDGQVLGRVRKQTPALWESYYFTGEAGPHVIDTPLGRIGVGICYENRLADTTRLMSDQQVDLLLMPHSTPSPSKSPMFDAQAIADYDATLKGVAAERARELGIPTILSNKTGRWHSRVPGAFGVSLGTSTSTFPGLSTIADSDGAVKAQLGAQGGYAIADVLLDPSKKKRVDDPVREGRWAGKRPKWGRAAEVVETVGATSYALSLERRWRAAQVAKASGAARDAASDKAASDTEGKAAATGEVTEAPAAGPK